MGFKLPKGAREYHEMVNNRSDSGIKFKTLFDMYYLPLMIGLDKGKIGSKEELEQGDFVDYYPDQYAHIGEIIAGLLIDAEMKRKGVEPQDRSRVEGLMLEVIDQRSPIGLNQAGIDLLNRYAVTGMESIRENISKTSELETFLVQYYQLLNQE